MHFTRCARTETGALGATGRGQGLHAREYRGTSLIRTPPPVGRCRSCVPRDLRWSQGGGGGYHERGTPVHVVNERRQVRWGRRASSPAVKSLLSVPLICTGARRNPATRSANQGYRKRRIGPTLRAGGRQGGAEGQGLHAREYTFMKAS